MTRLTPEILLDAYAAGIFPMAESADDPELFWVEPRLRGILPLDRLHVPRRLARILRQERLSVRCDTAFADTMQGCAEASEKRPNTWINGEILRLYGGLFDRGYAHSVECWRGDSLAGGLYGVSLGAAFFGESMFSRVTDASKVALVHLVAILRAGGYRLLDVQFLTPHLARFGVIEIPRERYRRLLAAALTYRGDFTAGAGAVAAAGAGAALQSSTFTS
ncbi:MAG: leucyl/phenylalanyl-tRNA--protein transferase [Stellaceae bacterium]